MGAWGSAVFQNDAALDWVEQITDRPITFVLHPFRSIASGNSGDLPEADQCYVALAAAEIVAAGIGHPCRGLPQIARDWICAGKFAPTPLHVRSAISAVQRITTDSELSELWKGDRKWRSGIQRLLKRLNQLPSSSLPSTQTPQGQKAGKSKQNVVSLAAVRKIANRRNGGLAIVKGSPYYLGLNNPTSADLSAVAQCSECQSLRELEISGRGISDRGLEYVGRLSNLTSLEIDAPNVTHAGLAQLSPLEKLTHLSLRRVQITDEGLAGLPAFPELRVLSIHGSSLTPNVLRQFQSRRKCRVIADGFQCSGGTEQGDEPELRTGSL